MTDTEAARSETLNLGEPIIEIDDLEVNFAARVGLIGGLMGKKGADAEVEGAEEDIELDRSLDDAALIEEQEETDDDVTDIIGDVEDEEEA